MILTALAAALAISASDGGSAPCAATLCGARVLAPYFQALETARSAPRGRAVHVLVIGDSHSAGDSISGAWRDLLQARYGKGGRGVLPPGKPFVGFLPRGVTVDQSDGWRAVSYLDASAQGQAFGLSGYRVTSTRDGARIALSGEIGTVFNRAVVCAETSPGAGAVTLNAGPASLRISFAADVTGESCTTLQLKDPASSAEIITSGGPVTLTSWATFNDTGGVAVSNLGVVGAELRHFARTSDAAVAEELHAYEPDLIIIEFGTNEGFVARFDAAGYEALLRGQIARLRRLSGGAPIMLLGAPNANSNRPGQRGNGDPSMAIPAVPAEGWYTPPALGQVRAIQRRVAADTGCAFWSWGEAMGGPLTADAWARRDPPLMRGDRVHYNTAGGAEIARLLQDDLDVAAAVLIMDPPSVEH